MKRTCAHCGALLRTDAHWRRKWCSDKCAKTGRSRTAALTYAVDCETGCWNWTGYRNSGGYGLIPGGATAYRASYERHKGAVPVGLELDHLCRNTTCVNPDHLEPVTHGENMRRAVAKLTAVQVLHILRSAESSATLAARFGVHVSTIAHLRCGTPGLWDDVQAEVPLHERKHQRRTKLTPAQVAEIRRRLSLGQRSVDIARDFNLGSGHLASIKSGRLWPKVKAA